MPYKQYGTEVVEAAISEYETLSGIKSSGCPADDSTIYRWIKQFKERGTLAVGWMLSMLYSIYNQHIGAIKLQKERLLKQLDRLTQMLLPIKTDKIIGRTNIVLTNHHCGYI